MVQLTDTLDAATTARICADGCLVADVRAARVGIQQYLGREVDPDNTYGLRDRASVNIYRPEGEVFAADSMASFAAAPVTIDHPSVAVDASNWKRLGVGEINGDVVRDGGFVRVPIIVRDAEAVAKVNSTHKQLSMGYSTQLVFPQDGRHPDGTLCDAYQTQIRINHIAAVRAARGGSELKISDERPSPPHGDNHMKTLTIDGLKVPNVSDEAEAAIVKLQADSAKISTDLADSQKKVAEHVTALATKDAEIATLKQQVADAAITPAKLRDAAKAYALVCDKAKALGVQFAQDADSDAIMKAVVDAKLGDVAKDWTADQIAVSFATLTKDAKVAQSQTVQSIGAPVLQDAAAREQAAWAQASDHNAWRNQAAN